MAHDPISTPTERVADHLEPRYVFPEAEAAADAKLAALGRRPNVALIVFDDVGWGDFGCYGGGVAVGAPTPNIDRLARGGKLLTSCYSEPSCTPSRASLMTGRVPMRHGLMRPPMYGEPGGLQGEVTIAQLLSDAGYVTQAVGKWHMGENRESQPQHVGFDDFYGFLSVSDMYTEWRDPYFFPEVVYSEERTKWIENQPFSKCFVHAEKGGDIEEVEEVTIPVLSLLDDKWCKYSQQFIERMASLRGTPDERPWFLYHCTRGTHFDNYPHPDWLGKSPAKHPYKDALMELDDIVGRLVQTLDDTGQLDDTLIFITSDNGPEMETWPDSAYSPFRSSKGSTWEGGQRVPGVVSWRGTIEPGQATDGIFSLMDWFPTLLRFAGATDTIPDDRYLDAVDQTSFLLGDGAESNRRFLYYWLGNTFSAVRCGEYKMMLASTSDDDRDIQNSGGFSGVTQKYTYSRLYNLYLDPKEQHSYMIRKIPYLDTFTAGIGQHLRTFGKFPAKTVVGGVG